MSSKIQLFTDIFKVSVGVEFKLLKDSAHAEFITI